MGWRSGAARNLNLNRCCREVVSWETQSLPSVRIALNIFHYVRNIYLDVFMGVARYIWNIIPLLLPIKYNSTVVESLSCGLATYNFAWISFDWSKSYKFSTDLLWFLVWSTWRFRNYYPWRWLFWWACIGHSQTTCCIDLCCWRYCSCS